MKRTRHNADAAADRIVSGTSGDDITRNGQLLLSIPELQQPLNWAEAFDEERPQSRNCASSSKATARLQRLQLFCDVARDSQIEVLSKKGAGIQKCRRGRGEVKGEMAGKGRHGRERWNRRSERWKGTRGGGREGWSERVWRRLSSRAFRS